MKQIIAITCAIALLVSACGNSANEEERTIEPVFKEASNDELNKGLNGFSFELFEEINSGFEHENVFISPYSINAALGMTYNGASGSTKTDMARVMGVSGISDHSFKEGHKYLFNHFNDLSGVRLDTFNAIWFDKEFEVNETFVNQNIEVFDAYIESMDFSKSSTPKKMNKWISDKTNDLITDMISDPIDKDTIMILANTVNFSGEWKLPFEERKNHDKMFTCSDGSTSSMVLMGQIVQLNYTRQDGYRMVQLPYKGGEVSMYAILPEGDQSVNDIVKTLDQETWNQMKEHLESTHDVQLVLPKFDLEFGIDELGDVLSCLGMFSAFSPIEADFSGIADDIFLSSVKHKAIISVTETGTDAVAATVEEMKEECKVEGEIPMFIADRAFLFIIEDTETNTILFMGKLEKQ